jgi:hypothetical protein
VFGERVYLRRWRIGIISTIGSPAGGGTPQASKSNGTEANSQEG